MPIAIKQYALFLHNRRLFLACAVVLILVTHLTNDRVNGFLLNNAVAAENAEYFTKAIAPNLKALLFLVAFAFVDRPVVGSIRHILEDKRKNARFIALSVLALGILLALEPQFGLRNMGVNYGQITRSPFSQAAGWFNTRLLMPALAHIFFFREQWLYYFFFAAATVFFVTLLQAWNERNARLSVWQLLSLCTSSFVILQVQFPGYPDVLVYILFILIMFDETPQDARLSLLVLALIAHESSVFIGSILAWRFLERKNLALYLTIAALYAAIWVLAAGGDISSILLSHNVRGSSGVEWIQERPWREIFGIFFAYKFLWLLALGGFVASLFSGKYGDGFFIAAVFGAGTVMTFLGVDTSRLLGFAFPGLLVALTALRAPASTKAGVWIMRFIYALNLLTPSVYSGLNTGFIVGTGPYGRLFMVLYDAVGKWVRSMR